MLDYLNKTRRGTGGLLIIYTSMALTLMLVTTITFIRVSTARSVAESVEHTIALQCLASCYTHPESYSNENYWSDNKEFEPIYGKGDDINPQQEFNSLMQSYHLMDSDTSGETVAMHYSKTGNVINGKKHPTFEIQIGNWKCFNSFWDNFIRIVPNPVKVTIEDSYETRL